MKKYYPIIIFVLIIVLFIGLAYHIKSNNIIRADIANLSATTKSQAVHGDVRDDYLIRQIDTNFNLILTTVTILFGLFVVLTFVSVKEGFKFELSSIKKRINSHETSWSEHIDRIKSLEGDLSFEIADKMQRRLDILFADDNRSMDVYIEIVESSLVACEYYAKSLFLKSDVYPKFENSVKSIIKSILSNTAQLLSSQQNFEIKNFGYEKYLRIEASLKKVVDIEDSQNLAKIFSKLSFPTLD